MQIKGVLSKVLFHDAKTGYGKYVVLENPEKQLQTIVTGILPDLPSKTPLVLECEEKDTDFIISSFEYKEDNPFEQIEFLTSIINKRGRASDFIKKAGKKLFSYIASHPDLSKEDYDIQEAIEQLLWLKDCLTLYQGIPYSFFQKISHKKNIRENFKKYIYHIGIREGLSFTQCDSIWIHFGNAYDEERIHGAYRKSMDLYDKAGNTYVSMGIFFKRLSHTLQTDFFPDDLPIPYLFSKKPSWFSYEYNPEKAMNGNFIVYDQEIFDAEESVAKDLLRLSVHKKENFKEHYIHEVEEEENLIFGEEQKEAIRTILKTKGVKVLVGGPGTGKTHTIKGIIKIYKKMHPHAIVKLCAPTGRAAQRMEEATGYPSGTNHHLLEFQPFLDSVTHKDRNNPIDVDLLIMDEVSMCDVKIFSMILASIYDCSILLVGDSNQLPSVGAGKVLDDLMCMSDIFDVCQLTKVFRQAENSIIIKNSSHIIHGNTQMLTGTDFKRITCQKNDEIPDYVLNLLNTNPNAQVLSPIKKGSGGVFSLNQLIQKKVNGKEKKYRKYGNKIFKMDDRVILTRNCPEFHYYNGDMGIISDIDSYGFYVQCENRVLYVPNENLHDVDLAYAITVHKSQGSEFPTVIIVLPETPFTYRNLFYTAVTRASEKVIIIECPNCLNQAILKNSPARNSRLVEFIRKEKLCQKTV